MPQQLERQIRPLDFECYRDVTPTITGTRLDLITARYSREGLPRNEAV
jgi:hypothetical protein